VERTGDPIGRGAWSAVLLAASLTLCVLVFGAASALASLPVYEGATGFPEIHSPSDPEEFSWEVRLEGEAELRQVDEHEAAVFYSSGHRAFGIEAEPAHDADGATVPTTIQVTGEDVVTLTVHHRDGNPAAGGAPFDYPVSDGAGWEGGFSTVIVKGPPDEQELREQRERRERVAREEREAAERAALQAARCHVPALRGVTLAGARKRLRRSNCVLGTITKSRGVTAKAGWVVEQTAAPGSSLAHDAKVGVRLGSGGGGQQDLPARRREQLR
jgi:hypothetical protein